MCIGITPRSTVQADEMFGGGGGAGHPLTGGEEGGEKYFSLPHSSVVCRALRHMNSVVLGASHSPLGQGRVREGAQKWGMHMSLFTPSIRQYRSEYYRVHADASVPEEENLLTSTAWSTAEASIVSKRGYPSDFKVRASQFKEWEMVVRASLGIANHLDWFLSTVWRIWT